MAVFYKRLRREQHALIRACFVNFYNKGGAVLRLQTGTEIYVTRCYVVAIYGDAPAATKCTLTGSACPVCYTPKRMMSEEFGVAGCELRHPASMSAKRNSLRVLGKRKVRGANEEACARARKLGVRLDMDNAWSPAKSPPDEWVFGPDPKFDNVWQACPQVTLHGMDEGLTQKLNFGALSMAIEEASRIFKLTKTQVGTFCLKRNYHTIKS